MMSSRRQEGTSLQNRTVTLKLCGPGSASVDVGPPWVRSGEGGRECGRE